MTLYFSGNVVNGTIARQMVDMLVESSSNVEIILKFFDMFLKLKDIVASDAFRDYVTDPRGLISKKDFQKAMDSQKQYTPAEIQFLLSCSEADENEMIHYEDFANRFQEPAKDIGFNIAVLLTNLSEHVPHDARLKNFLEQAESVLNYFRPFLGRIEIMGASRRLRGSTLRSVRWIVSNGKCLKSKSPSGSSYLTWSTKVANQRRWSFCQLLWGHHLWDEYRFTDFRAGWGGERKGRWGGTWRRRRWRWRGRWRGGPARIKLCLFWFHPKHNEFPEHVYL